MNRAILCLAVAAALALCPPASPAADRGRDLRETPVVRAVRQASPAVVNISTEIQARDANPFAGLNPFFEDFFRDFFRDLPGARRTERSLGSGVIVRPDGTILTNEHVVANAARITVTRATGESYEARLVGADRRTDLAVLRVEVEQPLPHITLGTSADLMIGEPVIAIGNPFGLSHTVTTGVVSALNRTIRGRNDRVYTDFIQTDAAINPGNSGGPLLNILGELVGINSAIYQKAEGVGFAIPVDKARRIMDNLIAYGRVHRAWLGLQVQDVDPALARYLGLEGRGGVVVNRVFPDSPADDAGLEGGDLLLAVDGRRVDDRETFFERLAGYTAGSRFKLRVLRQGKERTVEVVAREIPRSYAVHLGETWLGLQVAPNSRDEARRRGLATARGLVITGVVRRSAAAQAGLKANDVIRQVNDTPVDDLDAYGQTLLAASQHGTVVLVVQRDRTAYYVTLTP